MTSDTTASSASARSTVVLLGASNLTRGISTVVETLRLQYRGPLRIVAALGHGRSFGARSRVLGRSLCSMLECNLWPALRSASPTFALITDIGNDVMYGARPRVIADWVEQCVQRLQDLGVQRINLTALPLGSIRAVKPWQFSIVRAVLFPTHDIAFETAMSNALRTQDLVEDLARRRGPLVQLVHHEREWYGFDPIHIKAAHRPSAWARFLAREDAHMHVRARGSFDRWRRLRLHMPEHYQLFGRPLSRAQPLQLPEGTTVEFY